MLARRSTALSVLGVQDIVIIKASILLIGINCTALH